MIVFSDGVDFLNVFFWECVGFWFTLWKASEKFTEFRSINSHGICIQLFGIFLIFGK